MSKIRWGLLAAGAIAKAFVNGVKNSETGELYAVGSRDKDKAQAFADEYEVEKAYGSYEELIADPDVDAVYISTPHPYHTEWAIKAAEAGKHLLVEKPMAINQYQVQAIIEAADVNNVFLMEAFMYRCNPQTAKVVELLKNKTIGDISVIKATFSFGSGLGSKGRLWENELGGGGILDVGGYTTSYARMVAGCSIGKDFAEPIEVKGCAHLHPETGVDAWATAVLKFENGILAQLSTGVGSTQENIVQIFGTEGSIRVPNPYIASRAEPVDGEIIVKRNGEAESITVPCDVTSYAYEADVCGRAILAGEKQAAYPAMNWSDSLGNIITQDAWRSSIGLLYESEKIENMPSVIYANRKLEHRKPLMKPGRIGFLDKDVS